VGGRRVFSLVFLALMVAGSSGAADRDRLLYHAETLEGRVLSSRGADLSFNPASVVKVGTTLWALERLGPDHRYRTVFGVQGSWDRSAGLVDGSLVVVGGGDPDFHVENVFMVARELNRLGLRRVEGWLRIDGTFWIGWENGVAHRLMQPRDRVELMGKRLRAALDPDRWDTTTHAAWEGLCARRGWDPGHPSRVEVVGKVWPGTPGDWTPLVTHRSNPLEILLKRFNAFSNNDIVRIAEVLGGPAALEIFLESKLGVTPETVQLTTASGEQRNRLTARAVVDLLREFRLITVENGLSPRDLLPAVGCAPGPTRRMFPGLAAPARTGSVVVKTGTLTTTDGGVAVVAGFFESPAVGEVLFCIAAPRAGRQLQHWRSLEQAWLLDLIATAGGAVQKPCGPELPFSDTHAEAEAVF